MCLIARWTLLSTAKMRCSHDSSPCRHRSLDVLRARDIGIPPAHVGLRGSRHATSFVYTETDNSNPGQNAVIAYRQNANGQVTQIGSFNTGGTGVANPQGLLGPDDSDKEVIASPDGRLLFAVNQGSNSIAVFRVHRNGSLALVDNTAVSSGGTEPVSLSIANGRLYVVNRGDEVQGQTGTIAPTITVFNIRPRWCSHEDWRGHDDTAGRPLPFPVADLFQLAPGVSRHLHAAAAQQRDRRE